MDGCFKVLIHNYICFHNTGILLANKSLTWQDLSWLFDRIKIYSDSERSDSNWLDNLLFFWFLILSFCSHHYSLFRNQKKRKQRQNSSAKPPHLSVLCLFSLCTQNAPTYLTKAHLWKAEIQGFWWITITDWTRLKWFIMAFSERKHSSSLPFMHRHIHYVGVICYDEASPCRHYSLVCGLLAVSLSFT